MFRHVIATVAVTFFVSLTWADADPGYQVTETDDLVTLETPHLKAAIRKSGYVTGVAAGSMFDKKTGFVDAGFGLDIVDWIMEPGKDDAYRQKLPDHMVYQYGNAYHGQTAKRSIEGPQICTKAKRIHVQVIRGKDFVAVKNSYQYTQAAPGKEPGSTWTQLLVFPVDKRYFISMDRIDAVNDSDAMFLRIDMPGHIKHKNGDTFSDVYLSYAAFTNTPRLAPSGIIAASAFAEDFAPDEKFNYRRDALSAKPPQRFIRAYRLRDKETGEHGPWLAGMTLEPDVVHEAWCHQRGYICMIQEFGGRPVKAGESFSAAFIVGYFDSIDEMHRVYDAHKGHTGLEVSEEGWKLTK